jgi:hypothetical protein
MAEGKRFSRRSFLAIGVGAVVVGVVAGTGGYYVGFSLDHAPTTITSTITGPANTVTTTSTSTVVVSQSTMVAEPVDLSGVQTEKFDFVKYYSPNPLKIASKVPEYDLPLCTCGISNFQGFSAKIRLSNNALNFLEKNGFAVISNPFNQKEESITAPYKYLKDNEIPIFITTDSLLHLYHIQFDETLRQIEEREFYDRIWNISKELLDDSVGKYGNATGDLREAAKRNAAYFAVGLSLLQPKEDQICKGSACSDVSLAATYFKEDDLEKYVFKVPDFVKDQVTRELDLIYKHGAFSESPIFRYMEDYSQYVPRGHYTRSEKLKNYFKAFMWYGRISMLLKGTDTPGALISTYDAKIQTIQACLIASKFGQSQQVREDWDRIYSVTAFYVGFSDDLGPYEYIKALSFVFKGRFDPNDLTDENITRLKVKLAEYRPPKIYGGTGVEACTITTIPFSPEQANQCLEATKGFRLMGQRYIPDSYMLSLMVVPHTDVYTGSEPLPFTAIETDLGTVRGFPRGLDVMALLGSNRAVEILGELRDSHYKDYDTAYKKLEDEFKSLTQEDWNRNLYWSWLFALRPLLGDFSDGYPTFMQTRAWRDKELTTALASWSQVRHDTILYAKQSYTITVVITAPPPEKPVVGYIEPIPEFYNRLLALTRMSNSGLDKMGVLDSSAKSRLTGLEKILERLVVLSEKELKNEELTQEDYDFIKDFGAGLNGVIADVDEKAKKTTIVADVHTDSNTKKVLEEGVGYVNLIVVAYKVPDGRILIGAGPVFSYYEFKYPMEDRLTDEKWRELLSSSPPEKPEWSSNFAEQEI